MGGGGVKKFLIFGYVVFEWPLKGKSLYPASFTSVWLMSFLPAMNLPIPVLDIVNLLMDEFNDLLSKHEMTEEQLTMCRDIRRRGKNKIKRVGKDSLRYLLDMTSKLYIQGLLKISSGFDVKTLYPRIAVGFFLI